MVRVTAALLLIAAAAGVVGFVWFERTILSKLPDIATLDDWRPATACQILDPDGEVIDTFYVERRVWVPIDELPEYVISAFVSAEDRRFWTHDGVDYPGIVRAMVMNWKAGRTVQGASTITQ
jgi:penicillin-binding protein 1A